MSNFIIYDGLKFNDNKTNPNYFYCVKDGERIYLHRYIYEKYHGAIPNGYHVHHIDGNPLNNDPSNLKALSPHDHIFLHKYQGKNANSKEYQATWKRIDRARNPEKYKKYRDTYAAKHKEELKERDKARYPKRKAYKLEYNKLWRMENLEYVKARDKAYYEKNKEKIKERQRAYYQRKKLEKNT